MTKEDFLFEDKIITINKKFIDKGWVTIYERSNFEEDEALIFCCTVNDIKLNEYLKDRDWRIDPGREGKPTVWSTYKDGKEIHKYDTYSEKGIEPFIFWKSFNFDGGSDQYIDISEEFILYYKLYEQQENKSNRKYYYIGELGEFEEVIIVDSKSVRIKLKYLMEYISVRKIHFSICFDFMRKPYKTLTELDTKTQDLDFKGSEYNYNHFIRPLPHDISRSQSWIHGKTIIKFDKSKSTKFHFSPEYEYEEFIVGYQDDGELEYKNCKKTNEKYFIRKRPS